MFSRIFPRRSGNPLVSLIFTCPFTIAGPSLPFLSRFLPPRNNNIIVTVYIHIHTYIYIYLFTFFIYKNNILGLKRNVPKRRATRSCHIRLIKALQPCPSISPLFFPHGRKSNFRPSAPRTRSLFACRNTTRRKLALGTHRMSGRSLAQNRLQAEYQQVAASGWTNKKKIMPEWTFALQQFILIETYPGVLCSRKRIFVYNWN